MNPLTNMRNVKKLSEQELRSLPKSSWHDEYKSSAWIFVGGLPYNLSEGDVMTIFSQYGEITNLNLVRDKDTGKQKGFCFVCYEDQRSTVLAVDNFNGSRILGRILRVDHVKDYKPPKSSEPTSKIKTEKLDNDDFQIKREIKTEVKQEILTPEIKREICSPEIEREICIPEIKREVCTPEIIRSPNNKKKKKSKDRDKNKKKHSRDRSKEKDGKKHHTSDRDKSYDRDNNSKRPKYSHSQERDIDSNDSKTKLYKEYNSRDQSRDRKPLKDERRDFKKKNYDYEKSNRKHYQKDDESYNKKYKK